MRWGACWGQFPIKIYGNICRVWSLVTSSNPKRDVKYTINIPYILSRYWERLINCSGAVHHPSMYACPQWTITTLLIMCIMQWEVQSSLCMLQTDLKPSPLQSHLTALKQAVPFKVSWTVLKPKRECRWLWSSPRPLLLVVGPFYSNLLWWHELDCFKSVCPLKSDCLLKVSLLVIALLRWDPCSLLQSIQKLYYMESSLCTVRTALKQFGQP